MLKKVLWVAVPVTMLLLVIGLMAWASGAATMSVIDTRGTVGNAERNTLYTATLIMLLIVVPVFILTFLIAIKYRATNKKSTYKPEWDSSKKLETIWWGLPILIVTVLSVITWQTSHSLDPYKAIDSEKKPLQVQVVALQWKWLFLYPEHNVASINELAIPVDRPIEFTITSDAPMNSFWIPQLGGQIYAMAGMSTKLHLMADEEGDYTGVSANLSGKGHANMDFITKARSESMFKEWVRIASSSNTNLSDALYEDIRKAGDYDRVMHMKLEDPTLYERVISRYSDSEMEHEHDTEGLGY
jgi:cytochrome o ubiquinol oxidase subunit 2